MYEYSSGIIWEQAKHGSRRFKSLSIRDTGLIEEAYQRFSAECAVAKHTVPGGAIIDTKTQVVFFFNNLLKNYNNFL